MTERPHRDASASAIARVPDGAIHTWFGLTYANWLVLPRAALQSMPTQWQDDFVVLLERLAEAFSDEIDGDYDVRVRGANGQYKHPPTLHYDRGRTRLTPAEGSWAWEKLRAVQKKLDEAEHQREELRKAGFTNDGRDCWSYESKRHRFRISGVRSSVYDHLRAAKHCKHQPKNMTCDTCRYEVTGRL